MVESEQSNGHYCRICSSRLMVKGVCTIYCPNTSCGKPLDQGQELDLRDMAIGWIEEAVDGPVARLIPAHDDYTCIPEGAQLLFAQSAVGAVDGLAQLDAQRWRALLACAYVNLFGWAGYEEGASPAHYRHFGADFWTLHNPVMSEELRAQAVKILNGFADAAIAAQIDSSQA